MSKGRKVINRKMITVPLTLTVATSSLFDIPINVEFNADTMGVKQITYGGSNAQKVVGAMMIYTSLVNDIIGSFYDSSTTALDMKYNLPSFSRSQTARFEIRNSAGVIDNTFGGTLIIHLEFLEHEKN